MVYPVLNTFVRKDIEALESLGISVMRLKVTPSKNPFLFGLRLFYTGIRALALFQPNTILVSWFCDYHSFLPLCIAKIVGRKRLIIVGGFDAVSDPENNYGIFVKKGLRQQIARWNYRLASDIWVVDASLRDGCPHATSRHGIASGLLNWMPQLQNKINVVPTGYDPDFWKPSNQKRIPKSIITVASITSQKVIDRKGIPLFIEMAIHCPDWRFTIVGDADGRVVAKYSLPQNLTVLGRCDPKELVELYSKHQIYFQASRVEGLPNVLCEAMLCGCIPLVQRAFGMEQAVGTTGVLFDAITTPENTRKWLDGIDSKNPSHSRERIIQLFHKNNRINQFKKYFNIDKLYK